VIARGEVCVVSVRGEGWGVVSARCVLSVCCKYEVFVVSTRGEVCVVRARVGGEGGKGVKGGWGRGADDELWDV